MATRLYTSVAGSALFRVQVYVTAEERQRIRELAARRGVSMSEYVKILIDRDNRGSMELE